MRNAVETIEMLKGVETIAGLIKTIETITWLKAIATNAILKVIKNIGWLKAIETIAGLKANYI